MRFRLASTVCTLTKSASATSRFVRPSATRCADLRLGRRESGPGGCPTPDPGELTPGAIGPQRRAHVVEGRERTIEEVACALLLPLPSAHGTRQQECSRELEGQLRARVFVKGSLQMLLGSFEVAARRGDQAAAAGGRGDRQRPVEHPALLVQPVGEPFGGPQLTQCHERFDLVRHEREGSRLPKVHPFGDPDRRGEPAVGRRGVPER